MAHIAILWLGNGRTLGEESRPAPEALSGSVGAVRASGVAIGPFKVREEARAALEDVKTNLTAGRALRFYLGNGFLSTVLPEHFVHGATLELNNATNAVGSGAESPEGGSVMGYSVMLWLVNPGEQAHEAEGLEHTGGAARAEHPGAMSGVNVPPAVTRLVYGHYDLEDEAHAALEKIEAAMTEGRALHVHHTNGHHFVIPAARVHYAVMAEMPKGDT